MPEITIHQVRLAYDDAGAGAPPMLFVHGWSGDRTNFAPQVAHFARAHRCVALDRTGHGESDRPDGHRYTIPAMADELIAATRALGLHRPVLVVHSQGALGLEVAARAPDLLAGLALIDAPLFAGAEVEAHFRDMATGLRTPQWRDVVAACADAVVLRPGTDADTRRYVLDQVCANPQALLADTWQAFVEHDPAPAAAAYRGPLLHVQASMPLDAVRLRALCPQVITERIEGTGHFVQLEEAARVNAILDDFVTRCAR